ncbi:MAG: cytochrome c3 family protein [Coriobacteriales bacterium]|jgi:hypothetical protein|nr:cytochrome c3 family protein [Coriobacteriales bacterium]
MDEESGEVLDQGEPGLEYQYEPVLEYQRELDIESQSEPDAESQGDFDTENNIVEEAVKDKPVKYKTPIGRRIVSSLMIVVGLLLTAGLSLYIVDTDFIQQPESCIEICHKPMEKYVSDYSDPSLLLSLNQHADQGVVCVQCHDLSLSSQYSMVTAWYNGDYKIDRKTSVLVFEDYDNSESCFKSNCHNDLNFEETYISLRGLLISNPHRDTEYECSDCHKTHQITVLRNTIPCQDCHGPSDLLTISLAGFITDDGQMANPHRLVDESLTNSNQNHRSPAADIMRCESCHGNHVLPFSASTGLRDADVSYCYRTCHHTYDFERCSNKDCHEDKYLY